MLRYSKVYFPFFLEYSSGKSVKCAICRNLTHQAEISYVNTKVDHKSEEDSRAYEAVKGSLSTKMEAVVKTIIKIQNDDPSAKSLVFSTWNDVLDILGQSSVSIYRLCIFNGIFPCLFEIL